MIVTWSHFDRFVTAANAANILVRTDGRKNPFGNGEARPAVTPQRIHVGTRGDAETALAVAAHELGHCLSWRKGILVDPTDYMLTAIFGMTPSRKVAKQIIAEEKRAWRLGYAFLRRHNLPVTDGMKRLAHIRVKEGIIDVLERRMRAAKAASR